MASEEAVILRRVGADARVAMAVASLAAHHGIEVSPVPQLPREVAPDFRAMIEREVLADTLERIVGAKDVPTIDRQLLEVAIGMYAHVADVSIEEAATQISQASDAITAGEADDSGLDELESGGDATPDALDELKRADLDALATSLGIADADRLPNKPAVIAAIDAVRAGRGEAGQP